MLVLNQPSHKKCLTFGGISADSHIALVTWDVQARDRNNQKTTTSSQQFKVRFIKEQGRQLIKSLEKEGKEGVG